MRLVTLVWVTSVRRGIEGTLGRCIRRKVIYIVVGHCKGGHGKQGERDDVLHFVQRYVVDLFVGR